MYIKVMLKKKSCGKNLNVLMKSWSVEMWNFTKSVVMQGGFLLKCVRYSQSLDDDVQFTVRLCLSPQQSNNTMTNNSDKDIIIYGLVASLWNGQTMATGMSFYSFFFIHFFNPLYYSYKICLQSFKGLGSAVAALH